MATIYAFGTLHRRNFAEILLTYLIRPVWCRYQLKNDKCMRSALRFERMLSCGTKRDSVLATVCTNPLAFRRVHYFGRLPNHWSEAPELQITRLNAACGAPQNHVRTERTHKIGTRLSSVAKMRFVSMANRWKSDWELVLLKCSRKLCAHLRKC